MRGTIRPDEIPRFDRNVLVETDSFVQKNWNTNPQTVSTLLHWAYIFFLIIKYTQFVQM